MRDGGRRHPNALLRAVAVDDDLGMTCLGWAWLKDTGRVVRIVTPDCARIVHIGHIRDHSEPRHCPGMPLPPRLRELAR